MFSFCNWRYQKQTLKVVSLIACVAYFTQLGLPALKVLLSVRPFPSDTCDISVTLFSTTKDDFDEISLLLLLLLRRCVPAICSSPLKTDICQVYFTLTYKYIENISFALLLQSINN